MSNESEKRIGRTVGVLKKDCTVWFELNVGKRLR